MRVLIINELAKFGGAEMQTMRECTLLNQFGNEAIVLTLDPNFKQGWNLKSHYNISRKDSFLKRQVQMLFSDQVIVDEIKEVITYFNPDYIHLNNTRAHALSIYKAVIGYKCLRTIRDYGAVCPTSQCICADLSLCDGYTNCIKCMTKCWIRNNIIKEMWNWICFKRRNNCQKKAIMNFACPSQMLTDYCNRAGLKTTCINNPFDFSMIIGKKKETDFKKKIFLYYGQIIGFKGIEQLVEAFAIFSKNKQDVELHLAGLIPEKYKETFDKLLQKNKECKIKYIGKLEYDRMIMELLKVHTVVIPSVWIENYPNTALEAISVGCLVIGSERGGMREIIGNDKFIFNVLDKADFIAKLELAYGLSKDEYLTITEEEKLCVLHNNSFDKYCSRLLNCLNNIKP